MAASDYDFNQTRTEIIERAYRIIGKLSLGETLSGEMHQQAVIALNSMVKSWQSRNIFLWTIREFTLPLVVGTKSYSLAATDPKVYALDRAYIRINGDDTNIDIASFRQYVDIFDKNSSGDPSLVALDTQLSPTLYVWPVPQVTRTLYYTGIVRLKDFDVAGNNPDFPVHYIEAITFGLAHKLSSEYGLPLDERRELERQFNQLFDDARIGDRERAEYEFVEGSIR
jgi:hypothetical protein